MGIFATIGSIGSSLLSGLGNAIGSLASGICNIVAQISIWEGKVGDILVGIAKIIHAIAELLGIESEDDPEILGAKAEQSDKKLEDFDNDVEAYIKYLKEEVELDTAQFEKLTEKQRLECKAAGLALETKAVEEKIGGIEISSECLATLGKIQFEGISIDAKTLLEVIKVLKEQGITNLNDVSDYLSGEGQSDRLKTGEALSIALGDGADATIDKLKEAVRKYEADF